MVILIVYLLEYVTVNQHGECVSRYWWLIFYLQHQVFFSNVLFMTALFEINKKFVAVVGCSFHYSCMDNSLYARSLGKLNADVRKIEVCFCGFGKSIQPRDNILNPCVVLPSAD